MSYQPTPYDEIEILLVMMGSLFLKGPEIDLTDLPKLPPDIFAFLGPLSSRKHKNIGVYMKIARKWVTVTDRRALLQLIHASEHNILFSYLFPVEDMSVLHMKYRM